MNNANPVSKKEGKESTEKNYEKTLKNKKQALVEVEQRFVISESLEDLERQILGKGGTFKSTVYFNDIYYDFGDYRLSKANVWLRNRAGIWEIKHPSIQGENPNTKKVAIYTEVVGYENVKNWLIEHGYSKNDMLQLRDE